MVADDVSLRRPTLDEVFLTLTGVRRWQLERVAWAAADTWTITRRDLIQWFEQPWRVDGI